MKNAMQVCRKRVGFHLTPACSRNWDSFSVSPRFFRKLLTIRPVSGASGWKRAAPPPLSVFFFGLGFPRRRPLIRSTSLLRTDRERNHQATIEHAQMTTNKILPDVLIAPNLPPD